MEVEATAKYVHGSPRKLRLILEVVQGELVEDALNTLRFFPSPSAEKVAKVVKSAAANAENNYQMDRDILRIVRAVANEGPMSKRFRPRSRGRVSPLLKRMSHITVAVDEMAEPAIRRRRR